MLSIVQYGVTGLMAASVGGYTETVRVLLEAKADPNITDEVKLHYSHCLYNTQNLITDTLETGFLSTVQRLSLYRRLASNPCPSILRSLFSILMLRCVACGKLNWRFYARTL